MAIPEGKPGSPVTPVPPVLEPVVGGGVKSRWRWLVLAGGLAGLGLLWRFEPAGQFFYPRCWMYAMTGLKCPACGVLRATHALLQGEFGLAWALNPLWVTYLPFVAWGCLSFVGSLFGRRWPNPLMRPWVLGFLGGLAVVYGVVRNLPALPWGG